MSALLVTLGTARNVNIIIPHGIHASTHAIDSRMLQCHGLQMMAGKEEDVRRKHGDVPRRPDEGQHHWEEAEHTPIDRPVWRQAAAQFAYRHRRN